jgi:hypothetical protein
MNLWMAGWQEQESARVAAIYECVRAMGENVASSNVALPAPLTPAYLSLPACRGVWLPPGASHGECCPGGAGVSPGLHLQASFAAARAALPQVCWGTSSPAASLLGHEQPCHKLAVARAALLFLAPRMSWVGTCQPAIKPGTHAAALACLLCAAPGLTSTPCHLSCLYCLFCLPAWLQEQPGHAAGAAAAASNCALTPPQPRHSAGAAGAPQPYDCQRECTLGCTLCCRRSAPAAWLPAQCCQRNAASASSPCTCLLTPSHCTGTAVCIAPCILLLHLPPGWLPDWLAGSASSSGRLTMTRQFSHNAPC